MLDRKNAGQFLAAARLLLATFRPDPPAHDILGGLDETRFREPLPGTLRKAARESRRLAVQGARRVAGDLREGQLAPALRR